ncbi:MAG: hypothetical protein M1429_02265 [Patescibacteria group bacterium]|nr:hypothetical protein [Patescibacteria group bacterium]
MKKTILIILAIIIVLGVGGYFAYTKFVKSDTSGGILSKVTLNPNCKYNDPDLCKFINGWKEIKYYTINSNDVNEGVQTQTVFKLANDKTQIISSQGGKEVYNVITIGDTTYTKDFNDNQWWKMTAKPTETASPSEQDQPNFNESDQTTYQKIGTDACGNLTCFKYQEIDPNITDSTQYIYFDNKDYQLRKMSTVGKNGSSSEATIDYAKISISEPSPVKSGSPYQGTTPAE